MRTNPFQEGENDAIIDAGHTREEKEHVKADLVHGNRIEHNARDPLIISSGPITRLQAKRLNEALNGLIHKTWSDFSILQPNTCSHEAPDLINVTKALKEGP